MRKLVWPLIPNVPKTDTRNEAHYDLFAFAELSWEIATKVWLSRCSFHWIWSETLGSFSAETDIAINSRLDPMVLQSAQWKVSLAASPGVAMRTDEGMSIVPQRVLRAKVFITN